MSLIRIAARIAAVEALKGKTLAGDNVLDSEIGAIDVSADGSARTDEEKPFIAVYADASSSGDNALRSLSVNGVTDFLFEAGITAAMTETNQETGESTVVPGIPATDRAFEFYLDMVARQIGDALTDPASEWAEIFRSLTTSFESVKRSRASSDGAGVRMAAQQIAIRAGLLNEPVKGATLAPTHGLMQFFAKADTMDDPVVATQIAMMRAQLAGVTTEYKIMQQRFGRTAGEAAATGLHSVGGVIAAPSLDGAP